MALKVVFLPSYSRNPICVLRSKAIYRDFFSLLMTNSTNNKIRDCLDVPTVERTDGQKEWRVNGRLHRLGGPAIVYPDGRREWFANGRRHRLDGPAIERPNGSKEWWVNGKLHRLDGPAVKYADGDEAWWVMGLCVCSGTLTTDALKQAINILKPLEIATLLKSVQQ